MGGATAPASRPQQRGTTHPAPFHLATSSDGPPRLQRSSRPIAPAPAGGTRFEDNAGPRFPPGREYGEAAKAAAAAEAERGYEIGEVSAGSLVLIHGNTLHKSERNTSDKGRIIYTFHVIEGDGTSYDERNWLQPPEEGFTKLYRD